MPAVRVRENESFEKALRRFTKSCEKSGLMSDIRKNQQYEKPSETRRRKMRKLQAMEK